MNPASKTDTVEDRVRAIEQEQVRLREASSALERERRQLIAGHYGVPPGARVISGGKEYEVVGLDKYAKIDTQPWLRGRLIKKDGTPSSSVQTIYRGWELAP